MRPYLILICFMIFPCFASAKLEKAGNLKQVTVHGFLKKEADKAVVSAGMKKYTLPWIKFARLNSVTADHETRQAKYILPLDQDLKVELQPVDKDRK
jgi:hypothetical protein